MMKLNAGFLNRHAFALIIGSAIAAGTLGLILFIFPAYNSFIRASGEVRSANAALQSVKARVERLEGIAAAFESVNPDETRKISEFFAAAPELATAVHALDTIARKSRWVLIAVDLVENGLNEAARGSNEIAIQAQFKGGGYPELRQLLALLANSVPILDVASFSFHPDNASVSVNIRAYRPPSPKDLPPVPERALFEDPKLRMLDSPLVLPSIGAQGTVNPFSESVPGEADILPESSAQ